MTRESFGQRRRPCNREPASDQRVARVAFGPRLGASRVIALSRHALDCSVPSERQTYLAGLLLVTVGVVVWSTAGLFTRILAADAPTILFWRGLFGAFGTCVVIQLLPAMGGFRAFGSLGRPGISYAALAALSMVLFISALRQTTVAHVAVITAAVPFIAALLGWLLFKQTPRRFALVASVAATLGVAIMVGIGREGTVVGDALAAMMAIAMAGMILISRRFGSIPVLPAICLASLLSAVATLPFATLTGISTQEFMTLAVFGFVNQVIGFGCYAFGARHLPPIETALITSLEAPLAPLWVWLWFAETPGPATIVGGMIVVVSVVCYVFWSNGKKVSPHMPTE